ncbi:MAG TPA: efflux RND transporter periplasmic adaptor subunit [Acidobacteriota bacterium]|nr:efflux RND transporter periplasmic adaptor subunit [Acidobacteriota bacterium]
MNSYAGTAAHVFRAILILGFILPGCTEKKKEQVNKKLEERIPIITGKASTRRVEYALNQVGTLEASQEVTLRSEIEGSVVEILFAEGRKVNKGEILVRLDAAKIHADIRNLEARIEEFQIRLSNKKRTLERNRPLVAQDLVSRQQFDNLETEIEETKSQIIQAKADLASQKERLAYTVIKAPFAGIAGVRTFSLGHYLKVGDQVVTIVDLDLLEINFQAPEKFKSRLFVGQDVILAVDAHPGKTFKGKVFFISPQVDLNLRSFQVKAKVENIPPLLNPGMFAHVNMITDVHEEALTVPWESVIQTETETYIYVVEGEVARKVPLHTGKITNEWAEILDTNLLPGTTVILEGKFAVKDGAKVAVKEVQEKEKTKNP